jgi:hypothetical protein
MARPGYFSVYKRHVSKSFILLHLDILIHNRHFISVDFILNSAVGHQTEFLPS